MEGKRGFQGQVKANGGFARQGSPSPRRRGKGKARPGQMGKEIRCGGDG